MKTERPVIYKYHDYQSFVVDMIKYLQAESKGLSMKEISKKLNITASYLSMVVSGKRELSRILTSKLISLFSLSKTDGEFFELLVAFNLETDDRLKNECLERMKKFKKYKQYNNTDANWHDYMSNWLNVTIREMTAIQGFNDDPKWIQENLKYPASIEEIKLALEFLTSEKIIVKRDDGSFESPDYPVNCTDLIYSNALAKFHREFLELAGDSIVKASRDERQLMGHCVALDESNFSKARDILNEALKKIKDLENKTQESEAVYFTELALFPLTKK